jgi:rod shape-determining protein MreB
VLNSNDTIEAFEEPMAAMLETIHNVLERTPPELSADINENGICMTGGGSLLYGLDRLISMKTGLPCSWLTTRSPAWLSARGIRWTARS